MNINLTAEQEKYMEHQLQSGNFKNASEVVEDALRLHKLSRNRVLAKLRQEINKGWNSPASTRSVKDIIKAKAGTAK